MKNKAGKPFQDALALLVGMVPFRCGVVKEERGRGKRQNKGNTIRTLDSLPAG